MKNKKVLIIMFIFILSIFFSGFTSNGINSNIKILNSGKCEVDLIINKSVLPEKSQSLDEFKLYFQSYLDAINSESGDNDFLIIKKVIENAERFLVKIQTRRIDKIKGLGALGYGKGSYYSSISGNLKTIEEYSQGIIREQLLRVYPLGFETSWKLIKLSKSDNDIKINPINIQTGNKQSYADFNNYLKDTQDRIVVFNLVDLVFIEKIKITFNGKLKYISSECVEMINDNTVEITPIILNATVDGEPIEVKAIIGFFVFKQHLSIGVIAAIILSILLIIFIILGIRFKLFEKFFSSSLWRRIKK